MTILCDFNIQTDRILQDSKPDVIIKTKTTLKKNRNCFLIGATVPDDHNIKGKEIEKLTNGLRLPECGLLMPLLFDCVVIVGR